MNKLWYTLFFAFYILVLFMFKPRQDVVFAAINETQYIRLFENGNEFELCVKDENYYRGTFTISQDTVFLWCQVQMKLLINESSTQIKSIDNTLLSAEILLDDRHKLNSPKPVNTKWLRTYTAWNQGVLVADLFF